MPLPVIADTFRVGFNWIHDLAPVTAANVIHIHAPGLTAADVFTAIDSNWFIDMFGTVTSSGHLETISVQPLDGVSAPTDNDVSTVAQYRGGASVDYIPQGCALIKLGTGLVGRSHRGRVYLPWLGENYNSSGKITGGGAAAITAAWVGWANAIQLDGCYLVVASYTLATQSHVNNLRCEASIATQRRRLKR